VIRGNVENRFLYATLLSAELLPFGHLDYRLVVLPIEPVKDGYRLLNVDKAHVRGFYHLKDWLIKAQEEWGKKRGAKAEGMSIYERLDRVHGLSRQNPQVKYRVLYNTSGTYLTACIVEKKPIRFDIGGQEIESRGFVADTKTYCLETENADEAYYLVAILNAPITDKLIKPMQSRGQYGPRDIHKKVLELPITQFDPLNKDHLRLTQLGKSCSKEVTRWIQSGHFGKIKSIGVLRLKVRQILKRELDEIDALVAQMLRS